MSSITIIQQKDAVHLITDAAHYDMQGVVCALSSKVTELPNAGCAFAVRGAAYPSIPLAFLLSKFTSLDEILEVLPGILSSIMSVHDVITLQQAHPARRHFEVTIAGWSEQHQCVTAGIASTFAACDLDDPQGLSYLPGYRPNIAFLSASLVTIPPVDLAGVLGRTIETQEDVDAMDPVADGLAVFEVQRHYPAFFCGEPQYLVGGFAELTTVTKEGITRRILKEWPDEIGETISPEGAPSIEEVRAFVKEQGIEQVRLVA